MRRFLYIITAALTLAGCTAREILVTKPVTMGLKIESVSGTKVTFSVSAGDENATYIFFTTSEEEPLFNKPENEAAKEHIAYLEMLYNSRDEATAVAPNGYKVSDFADFACFRGSRTLELLYLSNDTEYKLLLFQINPMTHEILGRVHSERFHTKAVVKKPFECEFSFNGDILIVAPSDQSMSYVWCFERMSRIDDDYAHDAFSYIYSLIDMYEDYGFIDHRLCRGTVEHDMSTERIREDDIYVVVAIGYEDGEINSDSAEEFFCLRNGEYSIIKY